MAVDIHEISLSKSMSVYNEHMSTISVHQAQHITSQQDLTLSVLTHDSTSPLNRVALSNHQDTPSLNSDFRQPRRYSCTQ